MNKQAALKEISVKLNEVNMLLKQAKKLAEKANVDSVDWIMPNGTRMTLRTKKYLNEIKEDVSDNSINFYNNWLSSTDYCQGLSY